MSLTRGEASASEIAPGGAWPIVGRDMELAEIRRALTSGDRGIVLSGGPGIGKSRLAQECLNVADQLGDATFHFAGSPGLAAIPMGIFVGQLQESDGASGLGEWDLMHHTLAVLRQKADGRRMAILVDDAHLIDRASATLLNQVIVGGDAFVVFTLRSNEFAPEPVIRLWKEGLGARIDVGPIEVAEMEKLVAAVLGGPVDAATLHWLSTRSEGNPLCLRELVIGAQASNSLRFSGGLWRMPSPQVAERLVELIDFRLKSLAEDERDAMLCVAFGEPLEVSLLESLFEMSTLGGLEEKSLIRIDQFQRNPKVRLAHPLYGDVLRDRTPNVLKRMIHRRMTAAVLSQGQDQDLGDLRFAQWQLEGGEVVDPGFLLNAARLAWHKGAMELADRLAQAALEAGAGFEAQLLVGQLAWLCGRADEADRIMADLAVRAESDEQMAQIASVRMDVLAIGLNQIELGMQIGEAASSLTVAESLGDEITAKRAQLMLQAGLTQPALDLVRSIVDRVEGPASAGAYITGASCLTFKGEFDAALELNERGRCTLAGLHGVVPIIESQSDLVHSTILIHSGCLIEAEEIALRRHTRSIETVSLHDQGVSGLALARVLIARGHVAQAARVARESTVLLEEQVSPLFLRLALSTLAHALSLLGESDAASEVLSSIDELGVSPSAALGPEVLQARAWVSVACGQVSEARGFLHEALSMSRASDNVILEAAALHDLARLGEAVFAAKNLLPLQEQIQGEFIISRARHAKALSRNDDVALLAVSHEFEAFGADLLAAECASAAAVVLLRKGENRRANACSQRGAQLAILCEGAMTPALGSMRPQVALTPREHEVAMQVTHGFSNREIAERLGISVRTVENQLQRTYEKLGIISRRELADALSQSRSTG